MKENMNYLKANDFVLISTSPKDWYILRVLDANPIVIDYSPQTDISGFLPMNVFTQNAESGVFNSYIVDREELAMQEFTNITNIFDADTMNMNRKDTDYLLQIYMGIAPSVLRVFRYYPSNKQFNQYLNGDLVHWGGRQQQYNIGYIDGFMSPRNKPTDEGEFYMLPTASMEFTFMNPSFVPIYPQLKFFINQMKVEPVSDLNLAEKILNRIVPARIVNAGNFNEGFRPALKIYGIEPVPLTASIQDLQEAGY